MCIPEHIVFAFVLTSRPWRTIIQAGSDSKAGSLRVSRRSSAPGDCKPSAFCGRRPYWPRAAHETIAPRPRKPRLTRVSALLRATPTPAKPRKSRQNPAVAEVNTVVYRMAKILAEGAGFEPAIPFPVYTLSRRAPSTTRPPLRIPLVRAGCPASAAGKRGHYTIEPAQARRELRLDRAR